MHWQNARVRAFSGCTRRRLERTGDPRLCVCQAPGELVCVTVCVHLGSISGSILGSTLGSILGSTLLPLKKRINVRMRINDKTRIDVQTRMLRQELQ